MTQPGDRDCPSPAGGAPVRAARTEGRVRWSTLFGLTSYLRSALWTIPFVSIAIVFAITPILRALDDAIRWEMLGLHVEGAKALLGTVITLTLSFMVFTFGSLLVAIQVAGGQLTPRIIATMLLRDNVVRYSVGLFVFSLMFSVIALDRFGDRVHQLVVLIVALLGIACLAMFLFLIDYAARLLRPVTIVGRIGDDGLAMIESVYPMRAGDTEDEVRATGEPQRAPGRIVRHAGHAGIVLAVDVPTLVAEAERADGIVELVPQVGDFVATGEPLFALHGGAASLGDDRLGATVALGPERTLEQDPMFAFRILVDIALKALSPAINDPTTAVLAIDQVHRLLKAVGRRYLRGEAIADASGRPRVLLRTPDWEDYVHIAFTEIRACGASSVQVARRLRAMLEDVAASLPPHRRAALDDERRRLDLALEAHYPIPDDLALARVPDRQGLGGSLPARADGRR